MFLLKMLPLFCLALNLHAQGVARTKPSTSTRHLTAIPSRSNVANRLKANEYIKKGMNITVPKIILRQPAILRKRLILENLPRNPYWVPCI